MNTIFPVETPQFPKINVETTVDYDLFVSLQGNRNINYLHLRRLKASMKNKYLHTIITVNEKYEIIDGHHRRLACQELNLPINYTIQAGYGLEEVQILNANMQNWQIKDYLNGYCNLGIESYIIYSDFVKKYGFQSQIAILLLTGEHFTGSSEMTASTKFKQGLFEIKDLNSAEEMAQQIMLIEPYYSGYLRRSFVMALIRVLKNPNFDYAEFIAKLKIQPYALQDCTTVTQYKSLIENIYNYRRKEKVNLRF